ncbi:MAG TPA: alkaline phosphatase family protein [Chitinophagaceae bacterium]|nr:alkaline phosphatase family protein [Chitinophagaceae bacterium]
MHNIGLDGDTAAIKRADQWLKDHLSRYVAWAGKHNSLLIFTFDEDQGSDMVHNHIPTFFVGSMVRPGQYEDTINHYSVLRTLEAIYHLSPSGDAKAKVITDIWK